MKHNPCKKFKLKKHVNDLVNKPSFASFLGTHGAGGCWSGLFRYNNLYSQRRTLVFL